MSREKLFNKKHIEITCYNIPYTNLSKQRKTNYMNEYQREQGDALTLVIEQLGLLSNDQRQALNDELGPYLAFRKEVDRFLDAHFSAHCTRSCYTNRRSACCSKDGIITFWADVVVNVCCSSGSALSRLQEALNSPAFEHKCTYLGIDGCCWQVRPLMCAMFLCDQVQQDVFSKERVCEKKWDELKRRAQAFRWPDRPVLFDRLEVLFMERGCRSSLMYINTSPGLLRIKRQAMTERSL